MALHNILVKVAIALFLCLLLPISAHSATAAIECEVVVVNGQPVPQIPPAAEDSGDEEGLQYRDKDGVRQGGFLGWEQGELVRLYALIAKGQTSGLTAWVITDTSPAKLVKWHNRGWKGKGKKAIRLLDEEALKVKDQLEGFKEK